MQKNVARFARRFLPGLILGTLAIQAQAQIANISFSPMSKTEAILGGAPSALSAIAAQQSGRLTYVPAVARLGRSASFGPAINNYVRQPVSNDRPDIFNSVALLIGRSPLDTRWNHVSGAGVSGSAATYAASLRGENIIAKLEAVNGYINARVRFIDDRLQFGVADRWMTASETLARGRGDCEDFALAKRAMLRAAGVPDKDLYLVVLKDLTRRADHAVLVVRAAGRFLVLDNGTNRIVDSSDVQDYKPVLTFTATSTYTHGYRREVAPAASASNNVHAPVVLTEARYEPSSGDDGLPQVVRETASLVPLAISL